MSRGRVAPSIPMADSLRDPDIKEILTTHRTVVVVGMSKNPAKDAHSVPAYLKDAGYRIIPVNPSASEILGQKAYPTLSDVPDDYEIVDLFRPSAEVGPIVDEAIAAGKAKVIWMQLGIRDEAAAERARHAGMAVVTNRCMRTEHIRLLA